jgi:hypothetical protein
VLQHAPAHPSGATETRKEDDRERHGPGVDTPGVRYCDAGSGISQWVPVECSLRHDQRMRAHVQGESSPRCVDPDRRVSRLSRAQPSPYCKMFTARAMTSATVITEIADCVSMISFAQRVMGITSVGLNAIAFVNDTYR